MSDYPSDDLGWLMDLLLAKAAGRRVLYGICAKAIRRAHQQLRDERARANQAPQEPTPIPPTSADKPPLSLSEEMGAPWAKKTWRDDPTNPSPSPEEP